MFVIDELDGLLSRGYGEIIQKLYKEHIRQESDKDEEKEKEKEKEKEEKVPQVVVFSSTYTNETIKFARSLFDLEHPPLYIEDAALARGTIAARRWPILH